MYNCDSEEIKKYRNLTETERQCICNGCGGKGSIIPVPDWIFNASCDHHDYNYYLGGTEADRVKADTQFLGAMLQDANRYRLCKRLFYKFWAYLYFYAVRLCGRKYFSYQLQAGAGFVSDADGDSSNELDDCKII